jgi:hypothetical protein
MRTKNLLKGFKAILLLCALLSTAHVKAQFLTAASYPFTASQKTWTPLVGGTPISFGSYDDGYVTVPIGFTFTYCGTAYTDVTAHTNGFIAFGSNANSYTYCASQSSLQFIGNSGKVVMAGWHDASGSSASATPASYQLSGTPGDRILTIEYLHWGSYSYASFPDWISYQYKLYENGPIEIIYNPEVGSTNFGTKCATSIGLSNSSTDWQVLNNVTASPTSSSTTFTTVSGKPVAGQSYLWGEVPCTGTPSSEVTGVSPVCPRKPFTLGLTNVSIYSGLTYQWQKSLDSLIWTNITGATTRTYTDAISIPTYYRAIINCTNSSQSYTTAGKFMDTAQFFLCYCSTSIGAAGPTDIGNVSLITYPSNNALIDNGSAIPVFNNPTSGKGYTDYRRLLDPAPLYADTQYRVVVSQISANATLPVSRAAVYLDYNRSGTFDPYELMLLESTSITPPFPGMVTDTFSLTIPDTVVYLHGITGMRVILRAGATDPDTCAAYGDGETEDYLVDLRYPPCDGAPAPGKIEGDSSMCIGYDYTLIDSTYQRYRHGLSRIWEESADNVNWTDIPSSVNKDTIIRIFTGQPKYYRMKIRCSHTGDSSYTPSHLVNVKASYKCYCHSQSMGGALDSSDVGGFTLEDFAYNYGGSHLENPRSWHKRQDFTDISPIEMFVDSIYEFSVFHTQLNNRHGDAKITVFVDFNNNKLYDIPEERIYTGFTSVGNFTRLGQVIIPNTVIVDVPTGMRVVLNNDISPNTPSDEACGEYVSGETEDYIVKFVRRFPSNVNELGSLNNVSVYPNPTSGKFTIGFSSVKAGEVKVRVSTVTGQQLLSEVYNEAAGNHSHELDMSGRAKGVYFVELEADGIKTTSKLLVQ